ncbi:ceramide glucosyltransferase [Physcia stellaris]|nr:ceramide glucosyltransferase [Physcia stellaris]
MTSLPSKRFVTWTATLIDEMWPCRNFSSKPPGSLSTNLPLDRVPHVTVLRPVKGIEPHLYSCLAATFQQSYPREKLTIYLCISSRSDPAFPILEQLLSDFPGFDAKILIEEEDPNLSGKHGDTYNLGPNPKIRNMSRGYREAKGDIIWIIDCNVWVSRGVCGNMVDRLCGFTPDGRKYKFVHQLPLVIDISESLPASASPSTSDIGNGNGGRTQIGRDKQGNRGWGSLLEELFLSTSHAKFYTAINTVAVAPCIVGKSNMFRRSHLNALTASSPKNYSPGIDFFSENICEDHLIGDLLWKHPVPPSVLDTAALEGQAGSSTFALKSDSTSPRSPTLPPTPSASAQNRKKQRKQHLWANHALLPHSLALQPMAHLPLRTYIARRTRWLRVRKFTVPLATLVEPGTESLLCSLYGAYGLTSIPFLGIPSTWGAFFVLWVLKWRYFWWGGGGPAFASSNVNIINIGKRTQRRWKSRLGAWVGREVLAFGIWIWAVVGGVEVDWRGRRFWVGWDASVHEMADRGQGDGKIE